MHPHPHGRKAAAPVRLIFPLALLACAIPAHAQDKPKDPCGETGNRTACADYTQFHAITKTIYLTNVSQQNDANEVLVALRNMLDPSVRIYLVPHQNAIVLRALPETIQTAERIISELTHPRKAYILHFTITTADAGKRTGTQHVDLDVIDGQRAVLKQGNKVPVTTGSTKAGGETITQYTYLDIGTNLDATLSSTGPNTATLKCKLESSALLPLAPNAVDPSVQQAMVESVTSLTLGKPTLLGKTEIPNTTQQITLEVTPEARN